MKLINAKDWKAVHFENRTILKSDRNLYPEADCLKYCYDHGFDWGRLI